MSYEVGHYIDLGSGQKPGTAYVSRLREVGSYVVFVKHEDNGALPLQVSAR